MSRDYKEYLNEKLQDPDFKTEWEILEPEFQKIKTSIKKRTTKKHSQTTHNHNNVTFKRSEKILARA